MRHSDLLAPFPKLPSYFRVSVDKATRILSLLVLPYLQFRQNLSKRLATAATGATPGKLVSLDRQKGCLTRAKVSIN